MRAEKILFALIRNEICGDVINEDLRSELTGEKYKELLLFSRKHDLSHIAASSLMRGGLLGNDEVSEAFNKDYMKAIYKDAQRNYAISLTNELLEKARIPHINLKGSVIRYMYPKTWMRTSCDIDILIQETDIKDAESVLCANNYVRFEDSSTRDINFFSPNKIHIEMHHTLTQDGELSLTDEMLKSVWEKSAVVEEGYEYRYSLTPEMFVIYHLAHMGRHLLHGGCGVRPFIDLWLIDKKLHFDKAKLDEALERCNLKSLYDVSMELGKVWLENRDHSEATYKLETYILCGGTYGSVENAAKVQAASGVGKVRSFFNLMFLPRKNLEVLYPKLKKHPILYPFYQIKRWFGYFDKNKRNRIKYITEQRNEVTAVETNETADLLNQLGLI